MRILVFSDWHIHHTHRFSHITQDGYSIRELEHLECANTIERICKEQNIDRIVFGGDAWAPTGDSMSGQSLCCLLEFFDRLSKICPVDVVVGNHDQITHQYHKLMPLKYMNNITVYDQPTMIGNFIYVPYSDIDDTITGFLETIKNKNECIVFSHVEISNIDLGNGIFSKKGIDLNLLKQFKKVFQGHYHSGGKYGKDIYIVGSTQRMSFKDPGLARKNIIIYDTETDTVTRESFESPNWLTFTDENIDDVLKADPNNYVKICVSMDILLTDEIKEKLRQFKGTDVHIDVSRISVNRKVDTVESTEDESEVIRLFVNKSDNSEEQKEALINTGISLLERVKA